MTRELKVRTIDVGCVACHAVDNSDDKDKIWMSAFLVGLCAGEIGFCANHTKYFVHADSVARSTGLLASTAQESK